MNREESLYYCLILNLRISDVITRRVLRPWELFPGVNLRNNITPNKWGKNSQLLTKLSHSPKRGGISPFGVFLGEIPLSVNFSPRFSPFQDFTLPRKNLPFFIFSQFLVKKTQSGRDFLKLFQISGYFYRVNFTIWSTTLCNGVLIVVIYQVTLQLAVKEGGRLTRTKCHNYFCQRKNDLLYFILRQIFKFYFFIHPCRLLLIFLYL